MESKIPTETIPIPEAISESIVEIDGFKLRCYQLDDGRRVFHAEDVQRLLSNMLVGH